MAHERAQMVDDVMVESAREPAHKRVFRRIIGRCREDVIHTVVKLTTVGRKIGAVDGVCGLEYKGYGQTNDQMNEEECPSDQPRRFSQHHHWQDKHVDEV